MSRRYCLIWPTGDASQVPPEAMPTMGNLQQMLSVLLGQGVQFAVHGVHGDGLPG